MIRLLLITLCALASIPAHAQTLDMDAFKALPILHEGRIKPIESFAALQKKAVTGEEKNAGLWLAETIFSPETAIKTKSFTIRNDNIKAQFSIKTNQSVFSYEELLPGLEKTKNQLQTLLGKEQKTLTTDEQALLDIHEKALSYTNLLRSFSALTPINHEGKKTRFIDMRPNAPDAQMIMAMGMQSTALKILPAQWEKSLWLSPWEMILSGKGSPASAQLMEKWNAAAQAYRQNDTRQWTKNLSDIHKITYEQAQGGISKSRLLTEQLYKNIKPYLWVIGLYTLGLLAAFFSKNKISLALTLTAITIHTASITLRIYILDRPPVGTLYESTLFVSLICAALGTWLFIRKKEPAALIAGAASALGLLAIAPMLTQNGDSLEVLVAVLNTNFWLSTHVICITIGYGVCILTAMLAHAALIAKAFNKAPVIWLKLQKHIHHASLLALFFTAFGTILGGIWADQSWGRFWGWDPKENGALLIVLWLLWVQHGRLSNNIKPLGFVSLMAALNIIVAMAWFGVNLLSVGLHSYGFIDGIAEGFAAFCILEIILISALAFKIKRQPS
jgi:ABC-type transport system involved in cytochrome c biogenesis permease subunit